MVSFQRISSQEHHSFRIIEVPILSGKTPSDLKMNENKLGQ
jgi:hypothetical protein